MSTDRGVMSSTLLKHGMVFDGTGSPGILADVLITDGIVAAIGPSLDCPQDAEIVDAAGCWVTPGFVDTHTHYDAEVEMAPELTESLRHGITTVLIGSCGLSFAVGTPEDLADMFCRVEGIPRDGVLPLLEQIVDWKDPAGYLRHLETLPLGPNVVSLLGHSALRAHVLGFERSLDDNVVPTPAEMSKMKSIVADALDSGYLGISINTLPWDKVGGDRFRSRPTPSVFARWKEFRALSQPVRARDAVFQGVPNVQTRWNMALFAGIASRIGHRPMKTAVISMVDIRSPRGMHRIFGAYTSIARKLLGADIRLQSLPNAFEMWVDGLENPILEELGAGTEALHLEPEVRSPLMRDAGWRKRFRSQWSNKWRGRAYHRDLSEARVMGAPDPTLVGKSFAAIAKERGIDPLDCFLDLIAEHGNALRWHTVIGNDRVKELEWIVRHPQVQVGFSDAGAHLRNMGFYNFPLRFFRLVLDAAASGRHVMTIGQAVRRVTGELADYFDIDAGYIRCGNRADIVLIDPSKLDAALDEIHEAPMPGFPGLQRLVRRNDDAVRGVWVNGRLAWDGHAPSAAVGTTTGFGQLLRSRRAIREMKPVGAAQTA